MAQMDTPDMPNTQGRGAKPAEDDDALRKRLLSRIAVAGVAIVGLLGGLAVFDSLNKPQAPALPKMAAAPEEPKAAVAPEEKPAEQKAEEKAAEDKTEDGKDSKLATTEAVPERTETPLAPPPLEKPLKSAKPVTPPATARAASARPTPPVAAATAPAKPEARQEIARTLPERTAPAHAPASRPLTRAAEAAQRFLVQVGVFSNHANAEELMNKLHQAGIPAQIESRVQVGPFASRAEADAARAKLKAMGLDEGMLVRR